MLAITENFANFSKKESCNDLSRLSNLLNISRNYFNNWHIILMKIVRILVLIVNSQLLCMMTTCRRHNAVYIFECMSISSAHYLLT